MRELIKVVLAVAVTEVLLWSVGVWSWVSFNLRHWPWLFERYVVLFPVILGIVLLVVRRWRPLRSHLPLAGIVGAAAGLLSTEAALLLAQVVTAQERAIFWNTVRTATMTDILLVEILFAFVLTLGWLHGATASVLTVGAGRLEAYLERSRTRRIGPST